MATIRHLFRLLENSGRICIALITAVAVLAAGCTAGKHGAPVNNHNTLGGTGARVSVPVSPGKPAVLSLSTGANITLPVGAVSGPGTLSGQTVPAPAPAPTGLAFASPVYDLELAGTTLTGQVTITIPAPIPANPAGTPAGPNVAVLASFDAAAAEWRPLDGTYDPASRTLTVTSPHLSIWSAFTADTTKILDAAGNALTQFFTADPHVAQPSCPGANQLAANGVTVASDTGDLVKWCAGVTDSGTTQLLVANNRSYSVAVDYPVTWTVQRQGPPDAIFDQVLTSLDHVLSPTATGSALIIVPGGGTIIFTVPRSTVGEARVQPSVLAYFVDAFVYGADTLAITYSDLPGVKANPTATIKAIALAFTAADCVRSVDALAHADVSNPAGVGAVFRSAVDLAVGCLADQWKIAYGASGFLASFAVGVILWLVDGIKLVIQGVRVTIDNLVYFTSYKIAVNGGTAIFPVDCGSFSGTATTRQVWILRGQTSCAEAIQVAKAYGRVIPGANIGPSGETGTYGTWTCQDYLGPNTDKLFWECDGPNGGISVLLPGVSVGDIPKLQTTTPPPTSAATQSFANFVGQWIGHTRGLTISSSGVATERIGDGCCDPVIDVTYQLSNPEQHGSTWTATATVTAVQVHPGWQNVNMPAPRIGQTYKLTLSGGVIVSSLVGTNYCDKKAGAAGICGA